MRNKADPAALREIIEEAGLSYRESDRSFIFDCPCCNKKDKLYIRKEDGRFVCWYCETSNGFSGRAEYALTYLVSLPLAELQRRLYGGRSSGGPGYLSVRLGQPEDEEVQTVQISTIEWPAGCYPIIEGLPEVQPGIDYLVGRGISLDLAQEYALRYNPQDKRVYFPIHYDSRLVGYQRRTILSDLEYTDSQGQLHTINKVLTSKGFQRHTVMFEDRLSQVSHCVVTEGPIDAIKAHLVGGNIATMGKAVTDVQIARIRSFGVTKLILAQDVDAAEETMELARKFADIEIFRAELPPGKDLGALSLEDARDCLLEAKPFSSAHLLIHLL
jgi:hypothetical protein